MGKILLYAICAPILSLSISLPLLGILDERLGLSAGKSSDLASFFVFMFGLLWVVWTMSLVGRAIKRDLNRSVFANYVKALAAGNVGVVLGFAAVVALRHRYDISVEAFLGGVVLLSLASGFLMPLLLDPPRR